MEMPEGYKRSCSSLMIDSGVPVSEDDYVKCLQLMKEMAEELERAEERVNDNPCVGGNYKCPILNKFREWK